MDQLEAAIARCKQWTTLGKTQQFVKAEASNASAEASMDAQNAVRFISQDNVPKAIESCQHAVKRLVSARVALQHLEHMRVSARMDDEA
jgi:hypothetical protein